MKKKIFFTYRKKKEIFRLQNSIDSSALQRQRASVAEVKWGRVRERFVTGMSETMENNTGWERALCSHSPRALQSGRPLCAWWLPAICSAFCSLDWPGAHCPLAECEECPECWLPSPRTHYRLWWVISFIFQTKILIPEPTPERRHCTR